MVHFQVGLLVERFFYGASSNDRHTVPEGYIFRNYPSKFMVILTRRKKKKRKKKKLIAQIDLLCTSIECLTDGFACFANKSAQFFAQYNYMNNYVELHLL